MRKAWTVGEADFLVRTHRILTVAEQACWLDRSLTSIHTKVRALKRAGRITVRSASVWTSAETQRLLLLFDAGARLHAIAADLRRTPTAVYERLSDLGVSPFLERARSDGLSLIDLAQQLGTTKSVLTKSIRQGRLKASRRIVVKRLVYSIAPEDAIAFLEKHAAHLDLHPDADWLPIVERARQRFVARYISQADVLRNEGMTIHTFNRVYRNPPTILFGRDAYYERAALEGR